MASVASSATRKSSTSPKSTSIAPPSETTLVNPTSALAAQSRIAPQIAPDCETTARLPGRAGRAREGGVEARVGAHHAQAVGTEDAHAAALRRRGQPLLQRAAFGAGLAEAAGQDYRGLDARRRRVGNHPLDRARRRDDDRQVGRLRQVLQARIGALVEDRAVLGIDRVERSAQRGGGQVAPDDGAERAFSLGGAHQRHGAWREQRLEVMRRQHPASLTQINRARGGLSSMAGCQLSCIGACRSPAPLPRPASERITRAA